MAIKASVQYVDSDDDTQTVNYYDFSDDNVRNFIDSVPSGNVQDIKRRSISGVEGNFLIRGGFRGLQVELIVRYKGTLQECNDAWKADREAFAKYNCRLGDAIKFDYTRCTLRSDSAKRITEEKASGATGDIWFDVRYVFDVEELA
jgi:hypothetical protein